MMILLSVLPLIFIKEKVFIPRYILISCIIPIFLSMLLTQSRNVYLAVFVCFIFYGIVSNRTFLITTVLLVIAAALILPAQYTDRVKSIADLSHSSNHSRISMWKVGFEMFKDHPLTGVADSHIKEIYQTYKEIETPGEGVHLHNNFLMILATTGIFGFLAYLGLFITIFIKQMEYFRRYKDMTSRMLILGSILVMISFHISGIFEWNFGDHEVVTVFFFLLAVPFIIADTTDTTDTAD